MTQEEKQLLLIDLCGRLPYQPICEFTDTEDDFCTATAALGYSLRDFIAGKVLIKPYLRPMSSMTEEEMKTFPYPYYFDWIDIDRKTICSNDECSPCLDFGEIMDITDWLNRNMFDYRGLIPMGLALEATKDMYKNE